MKTNVAIGIVVSLALAALFGCTGGKDEVVSKNSPDQIVPPGGTPFFLNGGLENFELSSDLKDGRMETMTLENEPYPKALRIHVFRTPDKGKYVQLVSKDIEVPIKKGDVVFSSVSFRCVSSSNESNESNVRFGLAQENTPPWRGLSSIDTGSGKEWKTIYQSAVSDKDFAPGKARMVFHLGFYPQVVDFADIKAINFGNGFDLKKLPVTRIDYEGREPGAPWRVEAEQRIEKYRKGDLSVTVTDKNGFVVKDADVSIVMKRHSYGFGSAISRTVYAKSADGEKYRETVKRLFNKVTAGFFWGNGQWGMEVSDSRANMCKIAQWAKDNDLAIRAHCLLYPRFDCMPSDVQGLMKDLPALRKRIDGHLVEMMDVAIKPFAPVEYDVLNEPCHCNVLGEALGSQEMAGWYKRVHERDATAKLYVNECGILTGGGADREMQNRYAGLVKTLIDNGAPLDGIGMQGHFGTLLTPPEKLYSILDRFAGFGKDLEVTEFDIDIKDEQAQANYTRDFMTLYFSHPATIGFVMWGFWEGDQWRPNGAMFRKDWSVKPNGQAYLDLVLKKWWTNEKGKTDASGFYKTRGFLGDYEITVRVEGVTKTLEGVKLVHEGSSVTISLN